MSFTIGKGVRWGAQVEAYELRIDDPVCRPLKVFTIDPTVRRVDGAVGILRVPFEPVEPGPRGRIFEVENSDGMACLRAVDLNAPRVLINNGLEPSISDPCFHQQMVYAVSSSVYSLFRIALGRLVAWGFERKEEGFRRLILRPHVASEGENAVYDKERGEIRFGYYDADDTVRGLNLPGGLVFTCLSHDVIAHEVTHALIDGLRSHFTVPTGPDVLGVHEGLADLVAVFHHFLYPEVLEKQIAHFGPDIGQAATLTAIAANFGLTATENDTLRSAIDPSAQYDPTMPAHKMGSVLVSAIFDSYLRVFRRKTQKFLTLSGRKAGDPLSATLVQTLASEAAKIARQFLGICIRAIDYCPPVDLELGEYLRAMITADRLMVPQDPCNYRETIIESFADRRIYPRGVSALSEEVLTWQPPSRYLSPIIPLSFSELRFQGDPSIPASAAESDRQARALGDYVTRAENREEFGLMQENRGEADPPRVQSIRTSRRVGPDGRVLFDLVAEVTQKTVIRDPETGVRTKFVGGSTVILGPRGEVRYVISKSILNEARRKRQIAFQRGSGLWKTESDQYKLAGYALQLVHRDRAAAEAAAAK